MPQGPRAGGRRVCEKSGPRRSTGARTMREVQGWTLDLRLAGKKRICHPRMSDVVTAIYSAPSPGGGDMRHEPAERILQLACAMQGSRLGLSLGDIETQFRVGRRT